MKKQSVRWLSKEKWSSELISVKGKEIGNCPISHEWLCRWIWQSKHGNKAADKPDKRIYLHLKHAKRRIKRTNQKDNRVIIPNRVPIEKRPKIVNKRIRPTDIEVDFMMAKNHNGAILVMTNRATLYQTS